MSWVIFLCACVYHPGGFESERTAGENGKMDVSYAAALTNSASLDQPMATSAEMGLRIQLRSDVLGAKLEVVSDKPEIVSVLRVGESGAKPGEWRADIQSHGAGRAKLEVQNAATRAKIDAFTITVAEPAKIDCPGTASFGVGGRANLEAKIKDASGAEIYAPSAIEWTLDRPIAHFEYDKVGEHGATHAYGARVTLEGDRKGEAVLRVQMRSARADIKVTVD